jgi:hypothetical protein
MLPGAVIAAQGGEIVFAERLDAGFGIDLGGRENSLLQFDHAVSASAGALEWPQALQIGIILRSILILHSLIVCRHAGGTPPRFSKDSRWQEGEQTQRLWIYPGSLLLGCP